MLLGCIVPRQYRGKDFNIIMYFSSLKMTLKCAYLNLLIMETFV